MGKLLCPLCGVYTSFNPVSISDKGNSWNITDTEIPSPHKLMVKAFISDSSGLSNYAILTCQACEKRFIAEKIAGEWVSVFPLRCKMVNEDIPDPIKSEFEEAQLCLAAGAFRAATAMCQIALEAIWQEKSVKSLAELLEKGIISKKLYDQANQVRKWGNIAKHKLIHDVVTRDEAAQLISYLEKVLDAVYIEETQLSKLDEKLNKMNSKEIQFAKSVKSAKNLDLSFFIVEWNSIIRALKGEGAGGNLDARIKSACEPTKFENGVLTIGFYHEFHYSYINNRKYISILEQKIGEIAGQPITLKLILLQSKQN